MIYKYNILNPLINNKEPYYDFEKDNLIIPVSKRYKYFVEAYTFDNETNNNNYYLLLGINKFDNNCRICDTNMYAKCKIKLKGEIKDFVKRECKDRGNIIIKFVESTDDYDVYMII